LVSCNLWENYRYLFKYWLNWIRFQHVCQNCNYRYLNNIKTMSAIVQDELVKPIDRAVWHVEHVLKFPNSRHLRYHGHDMPWLHYYATYLCLGIGLALLLYISHILYNIIIGAIVKIRYVSNIKRWIRNLKRKIDWYKFTKQTYDMQLKESFVVLLLCNAYNKQINNILLINREIYLLFILFYIITLLHYYFIYSK